MKMASAFHKCENLKMRFIPNNHGTHSCSKLEISVTEHLVEVVDKLSTTAVVFFGSSDLKKTTAVVESLSTTSTRCSVTEIFSLLQDSTNRMRNLHQMAVIVQFMVFRITYNKKCLCMDKYHSTCMDQCTNIINI